MRRLFRSAFNGAAAVSMVLFVVTCVVWVRSYWVLDDLYRLRYTSWPTRGIPGNLHVHEFKFFLVAGRGVLSFGDHLQDADWKVIRGTIPAVQSEWKTIRPPERPLVPGNGFWSRLGFGYWADDYLWGCVGWTINPTSRNISHHQFACVPIWSVALLFGSGPLGWLWWRIRPCRSRAGLCPRCGYDLRATPHRCPECGAVSSSQPQ